MNFVLVLQWPGSTESDLAQLVHTEGLLEDTLGATGEIDGHDMGSGEMNIFIETRTPVEAFEVARAALSRSDEWQDCRAAYREMNSDQYFVLWPADLNEFSVA